MAQRHEQGDCRNSHDPLEFIGSDTSLHLRLPFCAQVPSIRVDTPPLAGSIMLVGSPRRGDRSSMGCVLWICEILVACRVSARQPYLLFDAPLLAAGSFSPEFALSWKA